MAAPGVREQETGESEGEVPQGQGEQWAGGSHKKLQTIRRKHDRGLDLKAFTSPEILSSDECGDVTEEAEVRSDQFEAEES